MEKPKLWSEEHPTLMSILSFIGMFIPVYWPDTKSWGGTISVLDVPVGTWMLTIALFVKYFL